MVTQDRRTLERELVAELKENGVAWQWIGDWPPKATYYKPTGEAMPNLPADPWSMRRYLNRGFTLAPPAVSELVCEVCGRSDFRAKIGLAGHRRSHKEGVVHDTEATETLATKDDRAEATRT